MTSFAAIVSDIELLVPVAQSAIDLVTKLKGLIEAKAATDTSLEEMSQTIKETAALLSASNDTLAAYLARYAPPTLASSANQPPGVMS